MVIAATPVRTKQQPRRTQTQARGRARGLATEEAALADLEAAVNSVQQLCGATAGLRQVEPMQRVARRCPLSTLLPPWVASFRPLQSVGCHQSECNTAPGMGFDFLCRQFADREPTDPAQLPLPAEAESPPVVEARSSEQQVDKADVQQRWVRVCAWLQPAGGAPWIAARE